MYRNGLEFNRQHVIPIFKGKDNDQLSKIFCRFFTKGDKEKSQAVFIYRYEGEDEFLKRGGRP